jgi:solute carrier family 35 protein E3
MCSLKYLLTQQYGKTKQNELNANPMQILFYQSITSGFMLIPCVFLLDDYQGLLNYNFTYENVSVILLSCVTAFFVNFSFFLLVGKTSPLTYGFIRRLTNSVNVVGYFKTCVVFIGGVLFFSNNLDYKNGTGVTLTLLGVFLYTFVPKDNKPAPAQQAKEAKPVKPEERV